MRCLSSVAIAAASTIAFAQIAAGADMAVKAPVAPVAIPYSWTGFYIGGHLGYGFEHSSVGITGNTPAVAALISLGTIPGSLGADPKGWLTGIQLGYNYEIGKFVIGAETDFSLADIQNKSSFVHVGPILPFAFYTTSAEQRMQWFGTLRGRLGFTPVNNLMIYGTGGLAYGRVEYAGNINRSAILVNFDLLGSDTVTKTGWTAGGGIEYALSNRWSVKGEYLYYDLGSETLTGVQNPRPIILTQNSANYAFVTRGSIVRLGFNFRLN